MKKKLLITVKTYPYPHPQYQEIVCTAAVDEEGKWYRLYPIPYHNLPYGKQYKKWDWIEADIEKNPDDFRPETFHLTNIDNEIKRIGHIDSKSWDERKKYVLKKVYTNMSDLINDAYDENKIISLAVFKPTKATVYKMKDNLEWGTDQLEKLKQSDIFLDKRHNPIKKVPFCFGYNIVDDVRKKSKLRILDWEIGMLYWKALEKANGNIDTACEKVKAKLKYFSENIDLYLFLGTMLKSHKMNFQNPFSIVGLFYPPIDDQLDIFQ